MLHLAHTENPNAITLETAKEWRINYYNLRFWERIDRAVHARKEWMAKNGPQSGKKQTARLLKSQPSPIPQLIMDAKAHGESILEGMKSRFDFGQIVAGYEYRYFQADLPELVERGWTEAIRVIQGVHRLSIYVDCWFMACSEHDKAHYARQVKAQLAKLKGLDYDEADLACGFTASK